MGEGCVRRAVTLGRALGVLVVLVGLPQRARAATTWYVDGTLGNDANTCTAPGLSACRTIQAAINKASAGDTIRVAAGSYPEVAPGPLTVNKTLTLLGARNGVDARTRSGSESVVSDIQGTSVSASGVVIDGFTVQDSTVAAFTGYGIWLNPGISGTVIVNNIIQNNIAGIGFANSGPSQLFIRHNLIRNNNTPGPATGNGIYTDEFVGGPSATNILIQENAFTGNDDAGIDVSNTDFANGVSGLEVSTNSFDMNGRAVVFFNTHNSTVHHNRITNSTFVGSAALRLFDNNSNVGITFNTLATGAGHAIRLSDGATINNPPTPSSNVVINKNNIGVTGPSSFVLDGLLVSPASHVGTVNAECNWWGSASGPTSPSNPGGTGEEVVGDADFTPWWTSPSQGSPCPSVKCKKGDGDGDFEDKDKHKHHGRFHHDECENGHPGDVEDDDNDSGKHFESTSTNSATFTSSANSQTLTMIGTGLDDGIPVGFMLVAVDYGGVTPAIYTLTLTNGRTFTGTLVTGSLAIP